MDLDPALVAAVAETTTTSPSEFFSQLAPGTWTEFWGFIAAVITGSAAAFFGFLAWRSSRAANTWAELAVKAQATANEIMQAGQPVGFDVMQVARDNAGDLKVMALGVGVAEASAAVWIHSVRTTAPVIVQPEGEKEPRLVVVTRGPLEVFSEKGLPQRLAPGQKLLFVDPYPDIEVVLHVAVTVSYSHTKDGPQHEQTRVVDDDKRIDLP